ncbi:MAG: hypothetical protein LBD37_09430 [Treponema sp.]|jgi:hypothetical protein|nr:hypothetical protein [Treponema sp.]
MRYIGIGSLLILLISFLPAELPGQEKPASLRDLDPITARVAARINLRLNNQIQAGAPVQVSVGSFSWQDSAVPLGGLWAMNLSRDLANASSRQYDVLAPGSGGGNWLVCGEIIEAGGILRVYTRLIRQKDQALNGVWNTDFEKTGFIISLLEQEQEQGRSGSAGALQDRYEPDSRERPAALSIGANAGTGGDTWVSRSFHDREDRDWFTIMPNQGGRVVAETVGDIDTYMELYDASGGSRIMYNDDGGDGENAKLTFPVEPGKPLILMVRGYSGDTGPYRIRAYYAELPDKDLEPNDAAADAKRINLNTDELEAYFSSPEDVDWYRLEIPAGGGYLQAVLDGSGSYTLELYDSQEKLLPAESAGDEEGGVGALVSGGIVYLKASLNWDSNQSWDANDYALYTRFRLSFTADAYEPDNQPRDAKDLAIGAPQRRSFTTEDDEDWARITITQAGRYGIRAKGETSDLDTYLELFNEQNTLIDDDDDGGDCCDAYLSLTLEAGVYYLKVSCLIEPDDYYLLTLQAEE